MYIVTSPVSVLSVVCLLFFLFFFFNDTATTEIYTLSLHDALPISARPGCDTGRGHRRPPGRSGRSEEHTSELQSLAYLVCRLLLEKKKKTQMYKRLTIDSHANTQSLQHSDAT